MKKQKITKHQIKNEILNCIKNNQFHIFLMQFTDS